ncbi:MAG: hypothetical protein QXS20_08980 [Candidatus Thorarchaeota archaeon]
MSQDPELTRLGNERRLSLTQEFAQKHADIRERLRRLPTDEVLAVSQRFSCPSQIASAAYLINMDGLLDLKKAVYLLSNELSRRAATGHEVPNIPGSFLEFAAAESRWLEYLHGPFVREMYLKMRDVENAESSVSHDDMTTEQALSLLAVRMRLAESFLVPLIDAWLSEHPGSNGIDMLQSFLPPLTGWSPVAVCGRVLHARSGCVAFFKRLCDIITQIPGSATSESAIRRANRVLDDLKMDIASMSSSSLAQLVIHVAPRPTGRGDKSSLVSIGSSSTRGSKAEPDMDSPFDFLERDVRLAARRRREDRIMYIRDRLERIVRVLRHQGMGLIECVEKCESEIAKRLQIPNVPLDEIREEVAEKIESAGADARDVVAVSLIGDFLEKYVYGRETA